MKDLVLLEREELLQFQSQRLVAGNLQLAGEEKLHARGGVLLQFLEIVGGDGDRTIGGLFTGR
jgi:hypothetical protein